MLFGLPIASLFIFIVHHKKYNKKKKKQKYIKDYKIYNLSLMLFPLGNLTSTIDRDTPDQTELTAFGTNIYEYTIH